MELIVSPTTVALNPQQGAAVPAFKPGDIIEAQVLALIGENAARLAVGKLIMEVQTQVPLLVGSTVRLAVKNTPDGIRLTLLGNAPGSASAAGVGAEGIASGSQGPGAMPGAGAPVSAGDAPATAVTIGTPSAAMAVATGTAAQSSGGIAGAPRGAAPLAAGSTALGTSGAASTVMLAAADPQAAVAPSPNPVIAATAVLAAAVQSSAARQNGLAPLLADAEVAMKLAGLPEPVRQATERLLALQPTLDETTSADMIREALGRSGLFLEARLSAVADSDASNRPDATPGLAAAGSTAAEFFASAPPDDLKAALIVLRNVLKTWLAADPKGAASAPAAALKTGSLPLDLRSAPPLAPEEATRPDELRLPGAAAPPPPYRGAPPAAQPAAAPSISPGMMPHEIGKVLLRETDAALARQTLLQAASLPDQAGASPRVHDTTGPRWNFEVPFATPQGSAVAQFEIARDGHQAPAPGMKPAWRARFSLDVEPIGPVHAQIALTGTRAAVTLWAERPETSARLRDSAPQLSDALRQAELEPGDVLVRAGSPPRPREGAPAGRFLDRAS